MSNLSQDDFGVTKLKNAVPWMYVISDVNDEQIVDMFYEKRKKKKEGEKKGIKNLDIQYVKLNGYDNSFNSWLDKKYILM